MMHDDAMEGRSLHQRNKGQTATLEYGWGTKRNKTNSNEVGKAHSARHGKTSVI